ncbi:kinase-like domain-containing protein [Pilaira anomala]|nr:kinase-like domain-containing protein [Pilaira anomala]
MHNRGMEEKQVPNKKNSFRRLSFFKPTTITPPQQPQPQPQQPTILTTNTISKEYDPETGNKIINNFMILKEIGRGMHGKVKLAQDMETGELVAIKIVDKQSRRRQLGYNVLKQKEFLTTPENEQKIRREIAILKKCIHPHVVRLREVIDDPASRKIYLALEYMEGGEIKWREDDESNQPVLSIDEARYIFRDVVSGLDYLHYQGIIHRDIKPANLLLTKDGIVKISDFGVSYFNQHLAGEGEYNDEIERELAETAGTPAFFAPELCSSVENNPLDERRITKAIDVWALGVTLYCLIFGQCPFIASTEFELFDIIPTAPLAFPFPISSDLQDLLSRLLEKDSTERITLDQVKHHPWVLEDLEDPSIWLKESDPKLYKTVHITEDDLSKAVTIMDKLRKSIHRISSTLSHTFSRKSSTSTSSYHSASSIHHHPTATTTSSSSSSSRTHSFISHVTEEEDEYEHHHQQQQQQYHHPQHEEEEEEEGWLPTSFTPSTCSSNNSIKDPASSGSSLSGLVVTFSNRPADEQQQQQQQQQQQS